MTSRLKDSKHNQARLQGQPSRQAAMGNSNASKIEARNAALLATFQRLQSESRSKASAASNDSSVRAAVVPAPLNLAPFVNNLPILGTSDLVLAPELAAQRVSEVAVAPDVDDLRSSAVEVSPAPDHVLTSSSPSDVPISIIVSELDASNSTDLIATPVTGTSAPDLTLSSKFSALRAALVASDSAKIDGLLTIMIMISEDGDETLANLGSAQSGLIPLLRDIICGDDAEALAMAMQIIFHLSTADRNHLFMASHDAGLLQPLKGFVKNGVGEVRFYALRTLNSLACGKGNYVFFSSLSDAVLPVLTEVVGEDVMAVRVLALEVLSNLALVNFVGASMASPDLGLLLLLTKVIENHIGEDRTWALNVLKNLSFWVATRVQMSSPSLGLLAVLVNVMRSCNNEHRTTVLLVLRKLSDTASVRPFLTSPHLKLVCALVGVIEERGGDRIHALHVLNNLSEEENNKLASSEFRLLPLLIKIVMHGHSEVRHLALGVLQNLCITVTHEILISSDLELLPALMEVVDKRGMQDKMRALSMLQLLSTVVSNQVPMTSPDVGLLSSLSTIVMECNGPLGTSALCTLQNLSCAAMKKVLEDAGNVENMWKALKVLQALSTATDKRVSGASTGIGLLPWLLKIVMLQDDMNTGLIGLSLLVLNNLPALEKKDEHLLCGDFGLILALKNVVERRVVAHRVRALYVMLNLSRLPTINLAMLYMHGLLELLIKVVADCHVETTMPALGILLNLSGISRNYWILTLPDLGLLPALKEIIEKRTLYTLRAMDILLNLSSSPYCRLQMACATIGLLPALIMAVNDDGGDEVRMKSALHILRNLSCASGNQVYMASSELGLVDALKTVAAIVGESQAIAVHILWNLSSAPENKVPMAASQGLLVLLTTIVAGTNSVCSAHAWNALVELSSDFNNAVPMTAHDLGLLQLLVRFAAGDNVNISKIAWGMLITFSETDSVRPLMSCPELGLLKLLATCVQDNSPRRNSAFAVLRNLACSTKNAVLVSMISPDLGMLPLFSAIAARCDDQTVSTLAVLHSLSFSNYAKVAMSASNLGLVTVLVNVVAAEGADNEEIRLTSFAILANLSSAIESFDIRILVPALMDVAARGEYHIEVLNIIVGLSAAANKVALPIFETRLVPFLVQIAGSSSSDSDTKSHALDVLINLVDAVNNRMSMASNMSLIMLFACISSDDKIVKTKALTVVSKLALHVNVCKLLISTDLEFVALLKSLLVDADEFVMKLASDILSVLSHFEAVVSKVLSNYGVPLELFIAICRYQLSTLDAQIIAKGLIGIPGIEAYEQAKADKARKEKEFSFALMYATLTPHEFSAFSTPLEQVNWIKVKLNEHSVQLMTTSDDIHLAAFRRFLCSLPPELGNTAGASYAEITEHSVPLNELGDGCVVVNGVFHDGPTDIAVKIKIKRSAHKDMLVHEHKIMDRFHKLAPSVVVAPFALVQASNRTLRVGSGTAVRGELTEVLGLVLERGTVDLGEHLLQFGAVTHTIHQRAILSDIGKMVEMAHQNNIVLMDLKPQNIVHCLSHGVGTWKAIDFEHSRYFGDEVAKAATAQYASYEMARHVLSGSDSTLKADPAMDICSFGWVVWRMFSRETLWEFLKIANDETAIFEKLANMEQKYLVDHINRAFPGSGTTHAALRTFLPQVLHVEPKNRLIASQFRAETSLFGDKDPTVNQQTVLGAIYSCSANTNSKLDELTNEVKSACSNLSTQLNARVFGKIVEGCNGDGVSATLASIVDMLEQQRGDARDNRMSTEAIARAMGTLHTDLASGMLPSITTIMADHRDQSSKLDIVVTMMKNMKVQLDEMMSIHRIELTLLRCSLAKDYQFPLTFVLVPQRPAEPSHAMGIRGRIASIAKDAYDVVTSHLFDTLYLFFYCPVTRKLVPCGKDGHGYVFSTPKGWVKQLIPVVKLGLLVVKAVMATQGLGGLIPNFPCANLVDIDSLLTDVANAKIDQASNALDAVEANSFDKEVLSSLDNKMLDAIIEQVAKQDNVAVSYSDFRGYCPRNSGLEWVPCAKEGADIAGAWVSAGDGKAAFERDGPAAFTRIK